MRLRKVISEKLKFAILSILNRFFWETFIHAFCHKGKFIFLESALEIFVYELSAHRNTFLKANNKKSGPICFQGVFAFVN
jgi:hypothetical protein